MEDFKKLLEETNLKIDQSLGSVFTKDDVKTLLYTFATEASEITLSFDYELVERAIADVLNRDSDCVDYDSAEFELDYNNTIKLQHVELNGDYIIQEVLGRLENK